MTNLITTFKTFIEGVDCTGKTTLAHNLQQMYGGELFLMSSLQRNQNRPYKAIFESILDANTGRGQQNLTFDRSPVVDIALNKSNSSMLDELFLKKVFHRSQFFLTTRAPYEKYQAYYVNKSDLYFKTDKYDSLTEKEYYAFANDIEKTVIMLADLYRHYGCICHIFYI